MGFRSFALVDRDLVSGSSMNRLVGARQADVDATLKVSVAERSIRTVDPTAVVDAVPEWLTHPQAQAAIRNANIVVGCLDDDAARLELLGITSEPGIPYLDLGTEIGTDAMSYGGRVAIGLPGIRCVYCLGELDPGELALAQLTPEQRRTRDDSYGVVNDALDGRGAAVISLNGVVASLGLTELMVYITGLREPAITLTYKGERGIVRRRTDEPIGPCPYCGRD
jgi:hypothetical protein